MSYRLTPGPSRCAFPGLDAARDPCCGSCQRRVWLRDEDRHDPGDPGQVLKGEGGEQGTATGSGFEIDGKGTILTNWHVVENAVKVMVSFGEGGKTIEARIVGKYPSDDVAVLQIPTDGLTLHPLTLGSSSTVQVMWVVHPVVGGPCQGLSIITSS